MKNPLANYSRKELLTIGLPALVLVVGLFWVASLFVQPAPPKSIVMTTGSESGAYHGYAKRYQEILARHGIRVELRTSSGSLENLKRLQDGNSGVMVGFIQGGTVSVPESEGLMSLGSMYYEPLWLFYRDRNVLDRVSQLKGKRLAIGAEGSGTRKLAMQVLAANGLDGDIARLLPISGDAAVEALRAGQADAALVIAGADSALVKKLLGLDGVRLMSFAQADAYVKRFPFLNKVTLPRGVIDLVQDVPGTDVAMLAATANLVVRDNIHPALISLLMLAASEIHGEAGMFQTTREFPAAKDPTPELSKDAERYIKSGPPFLQRYLPFWAATLVDRIFVMILPLLALFPIFKAIPAIYAWRVTSRIYRWYGELSLLEKEIRENYEAAHHGDYRARLDALEMRANSRPVPVAYAHYLYTLREHFDLVRQSLDRKSAITP